MNTVAKRIGLVVVGVFALLVGLAGAGGGADVLAQASPSATSTPASNLGGPSGVPSARFFGSVTVNGVVPAQGTAVTAAIGGVLCGTGVVIAGQYAVDIQAIQGCIAPGTAVSFTVGGAPASTIPAAVLPAIPGTAVLANLAVGTLATPTAAPTTAPPPPPPPSTPPLAPTPTRPPTATPPLAPTPTPPVAPTPPPTARVTATPAPTSIPAPIATPPTAAGVLPSGLPNAGTGGFASAPGSPINSVFLTVIGAFLWLIGGGALMLLRGKNRYDRTTG